MKKSSLTMLIGFLFFCLLPCNTLLAQRDMKTTLMKDIVKVENDKYSIEEFGTLVTFDKSYEVKIMAEAPVTLISRDNFLRFYGAFSSSIFATYLNQEGIKAPDNHHIVLKDQPADHIDLNVTISMSEKGMDSKVAAEDSTSKMNVQWLNQLFSNPTPKR